MKLASLIFILTVLIACNQTRHQKIDTEEMKLSLPGACYAYINGKDSILLHLKINGKAVNGNLSYNFFEKDDNSGIIKGKLKGNTLFATYTFESEGIISEREVAFLKVENSYVPGHGELMEKDGKMVFKDKQALNFESDIILTAVDCGDF